MPEGQPDELTTGRTLGRYRVLDKIGAGGMGEVYLAEDTHLSRRVAVKILPLEMARNTERMQRFIQEAKAASALNHPYIAHIYEVGETDGVNFIAMEYVDGPTLGALIHKERADLRTLLKYLEQVAEGLAKAHAAGIVHRDLKPENVIISSDGYAKILDFGVAKLIEPEFPSDGDSLNEAQTAAMDRPLSMPGSIVGTVGYMSPEQARGSSKIDQRSDIFSFGCILYEAATGGWQAFTGETPIDSLHNILHAQPVPLKHYNPNVPADLQRIVRRCLQKDPEDRYQSTKDVAIELRELRQEMKNAGNGMLWSAPLRSPDGHAPARSTSMASGRIITSPTELMASTGSGDIHATAPPQRRSGLFSAAVGAIAIIVLAALGFGVYKFFEGGRSVFEGPSRVVPLTSSPSVERNPALSSDGRQVAYVWTGDKGDNFDIYVKITDAGTPLRLTSSAAKDMSPAFSPDGRFVAFLRGDTPDKGYYIVPALGGAERRVADAFGWPDAGTRPEAIDWSPDGKTLALVDRPSESEPWSVFVVNVETGERKKISTPPSDFDGDTMVAFSPDGRTIAFLRRRDAVSSDLYTVPVEGGDPTQVTTDTVPIRGVDWAPDGERLVFSSERAGGNSNLWTIPATGGSPTLIPGATDNVTEISVASKGDRLVYAQLSLDVNLWRLEIPAAGENKKAAPPSKFIISNRAETDPAYSPNGQKIAFSSNRTGNSEIWVADGEGQNPVQLTNFGSTTVTGSPRWSPDGKFVAFDSRVGGNADIYVVGSDGGAPRRLTTDPVDDVVPTWSRDGRFIYFASKKTGRFEIWKTPASGGDAVQVTRVGSFICAESLDGKTLFYTRGRPSPGLWAIDLATGNESQMLDLNVGRNWSVGEKGIYFFRLPPGDADPYTLEFFDFATRQTRSLVTLQGPARTFSVSIMTVSPDERWAVYAQRDQLDFDLMLVENFK